MSYKDAYISTGDADFSGDLTEMNIPGVTVMTRLQAAVCWDNVIQHTIEFASDAAIGLFAFWLSEKIKKRTPDKTTRNGKEMPDNITQITVIINQFKAEKE